MIKNMIMRLWVLCVALLAMPLQADESSVLDLARRITGHYEPDSEIKKIQVKVWDSMTDEARKYIRFMNAKPSRVFRQREEGDERCPKEIESLEDLEDTVYDMHFNLESARTIQLSSKVDPEEWELWIKKVNTVMSFCVASYGEGTTRDFYVFYGSDARVLAAFRNPMLESELNEQEKELLEVCAQWIADNIEENMPNLLKIKKVHDALVDNCKYTYGYYDTYNMIVKGRGVCAAYTSSTRMLLHMLKIDCRCVRGTEAMNHIWNIIDVNGDWYFTDVTWDDPIAPDGRDVKRFTYFLLTKAEMEMSHEWEEPEIYPETPAINKLGLFKRHDHREVKGDVNEEEENNLVYPRERESVLDTILEMRRKEIEKQIDKMQKPAEPLLKAASSAAVPVVKNTKSVSTFIPRKKRASKSKAEYKPINTLDDLYENLEICCRELDGPNVTFDVVNSCGCFAQQMLMADYHLYVKYWNFRYDSKERKLKLDIEHWPHIKLLSTHKSSKWAKIKLSADEQTALTKCKTMVEKFGTIWKMDRQKLADVYEELIRTLSWQPGPSSVTSVLNENAGGSLGYTEALHVMLTMMNIPSQLVHGRTANSVRTWLMVQRTNKKWYHVDVAGDAEKGNGHKAKFEYLLRCDDEMYDTHVWDMKEMPATPIKDRDRAAKQGLIKKEKSPALLKKLLKS